VSCFAAVASHGSGRSMLRRELGARPCGSCLGIMFAVDDIEDILVRLQAHGAELVGEASSKRTATGSATYAAPRASSSALGEQLG